MSESRDSGKQLRLDAWPQWIDAAAPRQAGTAAPKHARSVQQLAPPRVSRPRIDDGSPSWASSLSAQMACTLRARWLPLAALGARPMHVLLLLTMSFQDLAGGTALRSERQRSRGFQTDQKEQTRDPWGAHSWVRVFGALPCVRLSASSHTRWVAMDSAARRPWWFSSWR